MGRRQMSGRMMTLYTLAFVAVIVLIAGSQNGFGGLLPDTWIRALLEGVHLSGHTSKAISNKSWSSCATKSDCPPQDFSFYIQSGAASVVGPRICVQNKVVLGTVLNNAGVGINVVLLNGRTGEVTKTDHFDMFNGEVGPLLHFLKTIEKGSVVLMASYDEPASKLNAEARRLIAELGSSAIQSLAFRDNWVFVGGKGETGRSTFEKHLKKTENDKYSGWPELIELQGCIPKYPE